MYQCLLVGFYFYVSYVIFIGESCITVNFTDGFKTQIDASCTEYIIIFVNVLKLSDTSLTSKFYNDTRLTSKDNIVSL
jgi:hypothetical protein